MRRSCDSGAFRPASHFLGPLRLKIRTAQPEHSCYNISVQESLSTAQQVASIRAGSRLCRIFCRDVRRKSPPIPDPFPHSLPTGRASVVRSEGKGEKQVAEEVKSSPVNGGGFRWGSGCRLENAAFALSLMRMRDGASAIALQPNRAAKSPMAALLQQFAAKSCSRFSNLRGKPVVAAQNFCAAAATSSNRQQAAAATTAAGSRQQTQSIEVKTCP